MHASICNDNYLSAAMQVARTKCVIGDPSYFMDKVKKVGQVQCIYDVCCCNFCTLRALMSTAVCVGTSL